MIKTFINKYFVYVLILIFLIPTTVASFMKLNLLTSMIIDLIFSVLPAFALINFQNNNQDKIEANKKEIFRNRIFVWLGITVLIILAIYLNWNEILKLF